MKSNRLTVQLIAGFLLVGLSFGNTIVAAAPPVKEDALAGVTQNWDKALPSASRFVVLTDFGGAAVRDNETGLVWEKAPDPGFHTWGLTAETFGRSSAPFYCADKRVGGRSGWRLPSIAELASLSDPSVLFPGPTLPPGHPFSNVQTDAPYWSATRVAIDPIRAYVVNFDGGDVNLAGLASTLHAWCVRGPMNTDTY
jgi:hypothetical protein